MHNQKDIDLSRYRIQQAKSELADANLLCENNSYQSACNRAYYAVFHAIKAVLALEAIDFRKHSAVIAYFNKEYFNKDIFPREYSKYIKNIRFYREQSDYTDFYIVSKDECIEQISNAEFFVKEIEKYLENFFIE